MAYVKEDDYSKLATAIATDFVDQGISLNDSVSKLATDYSMNQEQVRRLCEATNNTTFNTVFKKRAETEDDRLVDFEVADANVVLGRQIKDAEHSTKNASVSYLRDLVELDNAMDYIRRPNQDTIKTAGADKVRVRVVGKDGNLKIFSITKGYWEMPAGLVEENESKRDAAMRIILAKTGLRAMPVDLTYAGMEPFRGEPYHTFTVTTEKLRRIKPAMGPHGLKPKIEYREKDAEFELRPASKRPKENDIRTLKKTAEHLRSEKLAYDMAYEDAVLDLRNRFRLLYDVEPFESFEKKAAAAFGEDASTPLNFVRRLMKKAEVNYDYAVLQKHAGFVDTGTLEMGILQTAMRAATESTKHAKAIQMLEQQL